MTPFPPGASTDAVARLLRDGLSQKLRETVIVENRGGAGGTTGAAFVAAACNGERAGHHEQVYAAQFPV